MQENNNLQEWFGKSKVINASGDPRIIYHGTHSAFNIFDIRHSDANSFFGRGFYFTDAYEDAQHNYEDIQSPDRQGRISKITDLFSHAISQADFNELLENDDDVITDDYLTSIELITLVKSWEEMKYSYSEKFQKLQEMMFDKTVILKGNTEESQNEFYKEITEAISVSDMANEARTIPVYVKMLKPFDVENEEWDTQLEISGDFKSFLDEFVIENSAYDNIERFAEVILNEVQYHVIDYDSYSGCGALSKTQLVEILRLEDENDFDFSDCEFDEDIILQFFRKLEEDYSDYIEVEIKDNSLLHQFRTFLEEKDVFDMEKVDDIINRIKDNEINAFKDIAQLFRESEIFYDIDSNDDYSVGNILADFIYSLGYDGIIMDASHFKLEYNKDYGTTHYILRDPYNIKLADGSNTEFSRSNPDIRYKLVLEKPDNSIDLSIALDCISKFHNQFPSLPYTRIFQTQEEAKEFAPEPCAGFYHERECGRNFVGVVLENIDTKEKLGETLIHEHIGHSNMKKVLGVKYEPTMLGFYSYYQSKNVFDNTQRSRKEKIVMAEERFAESLEKNDEHKPTLLSRIKSTIFKAVRTVFPKLPYTSCDIENLAYDSFVSAKKDNEQRQHHSLHKR